MTSYHAAKRAAAVADVSNRGLLRMVGEDALDLLHRLSTQDLHALQPGEGAATVLTTSKGRILDVLVVQRRADSLMLHVSPGNQARVLDWLDAYTILEDSAASDETGEHGQLLVFGPAADEVVAAAASDPAIGGLDLYHHREARLGGSEATIARAEAPAGGGFHAATPLGELASARRALIDGGAVPIDDDDVRAAARRGGVARIRLGVGRAVEPARGRARTPCQLYQGVLHRAGGHRAPRRLRQGPASAARSPAARHGVPLSAGSKLLAGDGKEAGRVTSAVVSPDFGPIALGYVRRAYAEPGARLAAAEGAEVEVAELPFA